MLLPEIRLLHAATVLAAELHFSRAAARLHMSQSSLSKQILKLEDDLGFQIFRHSHQGAELTDAGRVFIAEAREAVSHAERAVQSARAVLDGSLDVLNIGKSAYTDPFLISALLSIRLPLFPDLKIKLWSDFSNELVQQVLVGSLDLALVTGVPQRPDLSMMHVADSPFYVVLSMDDPLGMYREVQLTQMGGRNWVVLGKHANAHLYDTIQSVAADQGIHPADIYNFTSPEEASELVREHQGVAFLSRATAWRVARDGLTMRPVAEERLRLVTSLVVHADNRSRLVMELVKAAGRKLREISPTRQQVLPLTA